MKKQTASCIRSSPRPILLALFVVGAMALTSCATTPPLPHRLPRVPVDETERRPCPRPDKPDLSALTSAEEIARQVLGFSVRQEAAISVCEAKKDQGVAVRDAYNKAIDEFEAYLTRKKFLGIF